MCSDAPIQQGVPIGVYVARSQYGLNSVSARDGNIPIIGMKDMAAGKVTAEAWARTHVDESQLPAYLLQQGDILLNRTNSADLVGKVSLWDREEDAVFASYLVRFQFDTTRALPEFVNHYLNWEDSQQRLKQISTRGVSQANINPTTFQNHFLVSWPSLTVQRRIAAILDEWDNAIATAEKLVEAKKLRLFAVTDRRLFGAASEIPIGSVASQTARIAGEDFESFEVLSCTKHDGLVLSDSYFGKQVYGNDRRTYKVVADGEFAYATNHVEEGSIGRNTSGIAGIVSPMYTTFRARGINADYLRLVLKTERLRKEFERRTPASVNRRGGLRWSDFAEIHIPDHSTNEQAAIADTLSAFESDLTDQIELTAKWRLQKRGLMQKLLSGDLPVPVSIDRLMPGGQGIDHAVGEEVQRAEATG